MSQPQTAEARIKENFTTYLSFLQSNDWREKEAYKFEFANWLSAKTSLQADKPGKVLRACLKSQTLSYSQATGTGIQFLRKSGRKKLSDFIGIEDVKIFKTALTQSGHLSKEDCESRTISFTALSGWLGTLLPDLFIPTPTTDFAASFEYLFGMKKVGRKNYSTFLQYQELGKLVLREIQQMPDLEWIYLNHINSFRTSVDLPAKKKYDGYDINWIVEDFLLYIHRVRLELRPIDYLTNKIRGSQELEEMNARAWRRHYAVIRDSVIVREVKKVYDCKCQICGETSEINPQSFVEGAHIKPLGGRHNGNDKSDNILCLCPNHHSLFDLGAFYIDQEFHIVGLTKSMNLSIKHDIDLRNLMYHRTKIYDVMQKKE